MKAFHATGRSRLLRTWAFATFGLASCTADSGGTSLVALVDLSGSLPSSTVEFYADALAQDAWGHMSAQDQLTVLPIDGGAEQRSEVLFAADLAAQDFTRPDDGVARAEERQQARRQEYLNLEATRLRSALLTAASVRTTLRGGTDILGALHAAAARFPNDTTGRRVLVIFSDMIQESPELDIHSLARSGEAGAKVLVEQVSAAGRVPPLAGIQVLIVGAGETGTPQGDDAAYFRAVRSFWKQLFDRAGASFDAKRHYGYRTQDLILELIRGPGNR